MSERTGIEWCDSTFNPWVGCTKISPACDHCYAEAMMDTRLGRARWGAGQPRVRTSPANWKLPLRWGQEPFYACGKCGWRGATKYGPAVCCDEAAQPARRRVFCASLADVFDNEVPTAWLVDLLDLIRRTPNLDWLVLTKRIGNWHTRLTQAHQYVCGMNGGYTSGTLWDLGIWMQDWLGSEAPCNVWLGATICNQAEADRDIPKLLAAPAAVRFLSIEPMLGAINLREVVTGKTSDGWTEYVNALTGHNGCTKSAPHLFERFALGLEPPPPGLNPMWPGVDWIIAGGESGPHARPSHPDWFRSLRDQCAAAGVPFMFKQFGEWAPAALSPGGDLGGELRRGTVVHMHAPGNPEGFFQRGDAYVRRVGKKAAGRLLDGVEHSAFPEGAHV